MSVSSFDLALKFYHHGKFSEADNICRQILAQQSDDPEALHLLGAMQAQAGHYDIAIELIRRAVTIKPNMPVAWSNLGNALSGKGNLDEAITAYRQAIAFNRNLPQAHYNLANSLRNKGDLASAINAYRQAIALDPQLAEAHCNLGIALWEAGQLDEAIAAYRQAIMLRPHYAAAFSNLGSALKDSGQLDEAVVALRRAIAIKPDYAVALTNLGAVLCEMQHIDEAMTAYRQALLADPNHAEAYCSLGIALLKTVGELDGAIAALQQSIALKPGLSEAHFALGNAFKDKGRLDQAVTSYRQAIALKPNSADIHSNLLLAMQYDPNTDASAITDELRAWNRLYAQPLRRFIQPHTNDRSPNRRLRIGYVSPDFREHPVANHFLPLLKHHDSNHFEIICYSNVRRPDAMTHRLRQASGPWRDLIDLSDEKAAELIRQDGIDILVDLALHTANNRLLLFARKPAPVQVTFAGYPGSTGLTAIDYRLSDPYLDPPGLFDGYYSEKTIRLPHSFWCYDPVDHRPLPINPLPALTNRYITFGCLNNFCKINPAVLQLWAKVLSVVADSRMVMLAPVGITRQETLDIFAAENVDPGRIEFFSRQPSRQYMQLYHRIDLGLDSFPYNGHTTSLDSYWMGVPVVTLVGNTIVSRAGWCQLSNLKLEELAGQTTEQFVQIAVELGNDLSRLKQLRTTLRQRMEQSPLMDAPNFARGIEAAYRQMWMI